MGEICSKTESPSAPKRDPKIYSIEVNGIVYEVINGDMCYEHVDVIVNSANAQLTHNTGISGSIVLKGGNEIQAESTKFVEENGSLTVGEVVSTGGGRLNCKHVIHAVLPIWIGGEINEEQKLVEAIKNTLQKADELKTQSIAFPALGGGVFGFPRDMAADITVHTCVKYFKDNTSSPIKLVKFMNFDFPTLKFFEQELRKYQRADTSGSEFSRKSSKSEKEVIVQNDHKEIQAQPVASLSEEHHCNQATPIEKTEPHHAVAESHTTTEQVHTTTVHETRHEEYKEIDHSVNQNHVESTEQLEAVRLQHPAGHVDLVAQTEIQQTEEVA